MRHASSDGRTAPSAASATADAARRAQLLIRGPCRGGRYTGSIPSRRPLFMMGDNLKQRRQPLPRDKGRRYLPPIMERQAMIVSSRPTEMRNFQPWTWFSAARGADGGTSDERRRCLGQATRPARDPMLFERALTPPAAQRPLVRLEFSSTALGLAVRRLLFGCSRTSGRKLSPRLNARWRRTCAEIPGNWASAGRSARKQARDRRRRQDMCWGTSSRR